MDYKKIKKNMLLKTMILYVIAETEKAQRVAQRRWKFFERCKT